MDKNPLVSVIIATYKRSHSLKNAIDSLYHQTYTNVEIIVVDDNANEVENDLAKSIVDSSGYNKSIKYIKNDFNKGSGETRNIGIRNARGDYVTFLDDDDIYLPNKIENQVKHMLEQKSDYCITDLMLYRENDKLLEYRRRCYIKSYDSNDLLKYHLMYHMTGTDSLMFKREYLLKVGCFAPINISDEFYLMQRAISGGGKFSYLAACDLKAYIHFESDGLSSGESMIKGENELFKYKKSFFNNLTGSEKRYIIMRHYAVLAFVEIRRKRHFHFISYSLLSFLNSPIDCIKLFLNRQQK
ncbi:glycosyltransferase [Clostridium estertheticum]|uniref:glycosyltransferase family 2 protein n=1 Tax=Clostridium estertheticum TaxID=238834 RepID=UPI0013E9173D|nr:glycosyltransferase family 2 protein [Clostridium estertheticum]MBZ9689218.1 glycosyltransferase [Clostridium estertheticum]